MLSQDFVFYLVLYLYFVYIFIFHVFTEKVKDYVNQSNFKIICNILFAHFSISSRLTNPFSFASKILSG